MHQERVLENFLALLLLVSVVAMCRLTKETPRAVYCHKRVSVSQIGAEELLEVPLQ